MREATNSEHFDQKSQERVAADFERLQRIVEVLREMGLHPTDHLISEDILRNPTSEAGFPLVSDGLNGIRASYKKDQGLVIWFTNSFENPDDLRRQEVVKRLQQEGLYN